MKGMGKNLANSDSDESFINVDDQQTNQELDKEDEHEEAISQMPTCNKATEHLNAL
jgi:hypothetical protein